MSEVNLNRGGVRLCRLFVSLCLGMLCFGAVRFAEAQEPGVERIVLLNFTADQCPACRAIDPLLAELEKKNYPIRRLDAHNPADRAAYERFGITTTPSFVMLLDGMETGRFISQGEGINEARPILLRLFAEAHEKLLAPQTPINLPNPASANIQNAPLNPQNAAINGSNHVPIEIPPQAAAPVPAVFDAPPAPVSGDWTLPLAATVRLRVAEGATASDCGTGTLIHTNKNSSQIEGLILTCGHLFRASQGKGPVQVDLFNPATGATETVTGECVYYDDATDIGFVGAPLPFEMEAVRLVPPGYLAKAGDSAASVGCSGGDNPTLMEHRVVSTDQKYFQPTEADSTKRPFYFIEVSGAPVQGRSGGGLFVRSENGESYLLGVCNAGDTASDEGYFLPSSVIYEQLLANRHLAFVYEDLLRAESENTAAAPSVAMETTIAPIAPITPSEAGRPIKPVNFVGPPAAPNSIAPEAPNETISNEERLEAALEEIRRLHASGAEVICIVNWPTGQNGEPKESEVIRLSR